MAAAKKPSKLAAKSNQALSIVNISPLRQRAPPSWPPSP
jgi:hypothetical protein